MTSRSSSGRFELPRSQNDPCFVVAEMSGNHGGQLRTALDLVDAAAAAGVDAIKVQTYTADTMTIRSPSPRFKVSDGHELWGSRQLYDLYSEAHTPWEWHAEIFDRARSRGLEPFSTPFDPSSVAFLESLGVGLYKTASAEIVDLPLIREVARTGKPIIMSTGMATMAEIDQAVEAARGAGCDDLVLLACTAAYPAAAEDARLANMDVLRRAFGVPVGISDHSMGIGVAVAAVAMGAVCIEKHLTLSRASGAVDAAFSMEPSEFAQLAVEAEQARLASSSAASFGPTPSEQPVLELRRSLYVVADVRAGDEVDSRNVRAIRPAGGLAPDDMARVYGRTFRQSASAGTPLTWDLL